MVQMQRMRQASLGLRLLAAFLVMLGTSASAFSSILCPGGDANRPCPMKAQAKPEPEVVKKSCCPTKEQQAPKEAEKKGDGCCCEIGSAPTAPAELLNQTVPSLSIPLAIPEPLPAVPQSVSYANAELISFSSDGSPPSVPGRSSLGRAPPVA